jgi:hypothetical protein
VSYVDGITSAVSGPGDPLVRDEEDGQGDEFGA